MLSSSLATCWVGKVRDAHEEEDDGIESNTIENTCRDNREQPASCGTQFNCHIILIFTHSWHFMGVLSTAPLMTKLFRPSRATTTRD